MTVSQSAKPSSSDIAVTLKRLIALLELVTDNRKSMPGHLELHWVEGKQIWGLLWVRPDT